MTPIDLHSKTRKELSQLARSRSIQRWHSMKKQDLINALIALNRKENPNNSTSQNGHHSGQQDWDLSKRKLSASRKDSDFIHSKLNGGCASDLLQLQTASPFWVMAKWSLTNETIERASVALGSYFHTAKPVIRIFETNSDCSTTENLLKYQIEIHGNVNHWYIHVDQAPTTLVAQLGFLTSKGQFFILSKSDRTEVKASIINPSDKNSKESPNDTGHEELPEPADLEFQLDAELIFKGLAHPHAEIELEGDIIKANEQGEFEFRIDLPNGRQVIPAVMVTADGESRKTIVLGLERSTKELEPQVLARYHDHA